jgi:hypothetical protein
MARRPLRFDVAVNALTNTFCVYGYTLWRSLSGCEMKLIAALPTRICTGSVPF